MKTSRALAWALERDRGYCKHIRTQLEEIRRADPRHGKHKRNRLARAGKQTTLPCD